jgi:hypothetical protein
MARRKSVHKTGIPRVEGIQPHEAWITFTCIHCSAVNHIPAGEALLKSDVAYDECEWPCAVCGFVHSKVSDLPFQHWESAHTLEGSKATEYFWRGFFRNATEHAESYWKQCNVCGRILPFSAFSRHRGWGPLQRQMECRACKGAINAILNPRRTKQQLHEASVRRRIADLLLEGQHEHIDHEALFERFGAKCFKTGQTLDIQDRSSWAVDHILPSKWLYPLTPRNAALLSKPANEAKGDRWPRQFYANSELVRLAQITGADLSLLSSPSPIVNTNVDVDAAVARYLTVREKSSLRRRIIELRKVLKQYHLEENVSAQNKEVLGIR